VVQNGENGGQWYGGATADQYHQHHQTRQQTAHEQDKSQVISLICGLDMQL